MVLIMHCLRERKGESHGAMSLGGVHTKKKPWDLALGWRLFDLRAFYLLLLF